MGHTRLARHRDPDEKACHASTRKALVAVLRQAPARTAGGPRRRNGLLAGLVHDAGRRSPCLPGTTRRSAVSDSTAGVQSGSAP